MPQGTFQKKAGRVQWAKNLGAVHTKGETVRKLKTGQTKLQNIATNNINNNKMMWSENLKKEFSDSLGGGAGITYR